MYTYDVSENGKLNLVTTFTAEPGTGPRHLVFHPNGQFAYLFGELDSTVRVLSYNKETGAFEELQKISTLPEEFDGENGGQLSAFQMMASSFMLLTEDITRLLYSQFLKMVPTFKTSKSSQQKGIFPAISH